MSMTQSTFSWEEPPANPSVSQDSEKDWLTRVATWHSDFFSLLASAGPVGCCGKTSLVSLPLGPAQSRRVTWEWDAELGTAVKRVISDASWKPWGNSGMGSPTECWTLNTSEFHNDAAACSLSDILETGDVPQRYFLSGRACRGILRRAEKRGKELPTQLRRALEQVAGDLSEPEKQEDKIL